MVTQVDLGGPDLQPTEDRGDFSDLFGAFLRLLPLLLLNFPDFLFLLGVLAGFPEEGFGQFGFGPLVVGVLEHRVLELVHPNEVVDLFEDVQGEFDDQDAQVGLDVVEELPLVVADFAVDSEPFEVEGEVVGVGGRGGGEEADDHLVRLGHPRHLVLHPEVLHPDRQRLVQFFVGPVDSLESEDLHFEEGLFFVQQVDGELLDRVTEDFVGRDGAPDRLQVLGRLLGDELVEGFVGETVEFEEESLGHLALQLPQFLVVEDADHEGHALEELADVDLVQESRRLLDLDFEALDSLFAVPHVESVGTPGRRLALEESVGRLQVDFVLELEAESLIGEGVEVEATEVAAENGVEVALSVAVGLGAEAGEAVTGQSHHRNAALGGTGHVLVTGVVVLDPHAPFEGVAVTGG